MHFPLLFFCKDFKFLKQLCYFNYTDKMKKSQWWCRRWIRDMGLTKEEREFEISYDKDKKIIILKKS